jgi:hypothetical protein
MLGVFCVVADQKIVQILQAEKMRKYLEQSPYGFGFIGNFLYTSRLIVRGTVSVQQELDAAVSVLANLKDWSTSITLMRTNTKYPWPAAFINCGAADRDWA